MAKLGDDLNKDTRKVLIAGGITTDKKLGALRLDDMITMPGMGSKRIFNALNYLSITLRNRKLTKMVTLTTATHMESRAYARASNNYKDYDSKEVVRLKAKIKELDEAKKITKFKQGITVAYRKGYNDAKKLADELAAQTIKLNETAAEAYDRGFKEGRDAERAKHEDK